MQRIQKLLSSLGFGSRRAIEQMITEGRVSVNGNIIAPGVKVSLEDVIAIDGKSLELADKSEPLRVLLYNKPLGEISSSFDPKHKKTVFDNLPAIENGRWVQVGRLDINTSGLLIFTNDGNLANKLMHPRYEFEREYLVRLYGNITDKIIRDLLLGIELEDGLSKFKTIKFSSRDGANSWYKVVLTEGKNREVRRLWDSQGIIVNRLIRLRYGNFILPKDLRAGEHQELSPVEIEKKLRNFI